MHRKSVAARMRRIAFGCVAAWTLAGAAPTTNAAAVFPLSSIDGSNGVRLNAAGAMAAAPAGDVNGDGRPDRILESRFRQ